MTFSKPALVVVCLLVAALAATGFQQSPALAYDPQGRMLFPSQYREWTFLSSGFNMSYSAPAAGAGATDRQVFDNVFVDPAAYKSFQQNGTWPDKTVLVLEVRGGQGNSSINKAGHFQAAVTAVEAHVKDEGRFPGKWAFYSFEGQKSGQLIPTSASCYTCHQDHAAVDTTFVQFYPTLLHIAEQKGTFSPAFLKEGEKAAGK